jgi:hypothetical protein
MVAPPSAASVVADDRTSHCETLGYPPIDLGVLVGGSNQEDRLSRSTHLYIEIRVIDPDRENRRWWCAIHPVRVDVGWDHRADHIYANIEAVDRLGSDD